MIAGILDTNIVIDFFRQDKVALDWLETLKPDIAVTPLTWLEVIYGAASKERQAVCIALLRRFDLEYPTYTDFDWAIRQMERLRINHGVDSNDCLIASVAYRLQIPLYTHNLKHMQPLIGKLAVKPY